MQGPEGLRLNEHFCGLVIVDRPITFDTVELSDLSRLPVAKQIGRKSIGGFVDLIGMFDTHENEVVVGPVILGRHLEPSWATLPPSMDMGIGGRPHVSVCVRPDVSVSGRFMMPVPPLV
ncbi:hypothetical protein CH256_16930 [Rhodococcus sp. 05-2254-6]|nr:hypothetical protein CH256_16930 [Rhodococcus sp. 05-2254-6]